MARNISHMLDANGDLPVYTDGLAAGWADWSWATLDLNYTANVHSGTKSIWLDLDGWSAFNPNFLDGQPAQTTTYEGMPTSAFSHLEFWVHRGDSAGGQTFTVRAGDAGPGKMWGHNAVVPVPTDNNWHQVRIPLADIDAENTEISQLAFMGNGVNVEAILIDDIKFIKANPAKVYDAAKPMTNTRNVYWLYRDIRASYFSSPESSFKADIRQQDFIRSTGPYGLAARMTYYGGLGFRRIDHNPNAASLAFELQDQTIMRFLLNARNMAAGQKFVVYAVDGNNTELNKRPLENFTPEGAIDTGLPTWQIVTIPLESLQPADGTHSEIHGVVIQEFSGIQGGQATGWLYLDEVRFEKAIADSSAASAIYDDMLGAGWTNTSWNTTVNLGATTPVQSGANSIRIESIAPWGGLYLYRGIAANTAGLNILKLSIYADTTPVPLRIHLVDQSDNFITDYSKTITPIQGQWTTYEIPLSELGGLPYVKGVVVQDFSGNSGNVFHVDEVSFQYKYIPPPPPLPGPTLTVNATTVVRPISDYIYGLNFADEAFAAEIDLKIDRDGGNGKTRYNYQNNVQTHVNYYFRNIEQTGLYISVDQRIELDRRVGSDTIVTMPMIGWIPNQAGTCSFSVAKYGQQGNLDPQGWGCADGMYGWKSYFTGNDPHDSSIEIDESWDVQWVNYLKAKYGAANAGGVRFYSLDNEPMLWWTTHYDVRRTGLGYDEIRDLTYRYGAAIKTADPNAKLLGPVLWGWSAYFFSAKDEQDGGSAWWITRPDRKAHGDVPFLDWYLQQMALYESQNGMRLLDYLDLHFYPAVSDSGGQRVFSTSAGGAELQRLRLQSTKNLFDPNYIDGSFIDEPVRLIPRMREWVNNNYPGTKLALTEYNWGALNNINGALAQADCLGIFGKEGLDMANLWPEGGDPKPHHPGAYAFRMYRSYDGNKSKFGDQSLLTTTTDFDKVSVYAAVRSTDNALTVVMVNKTSSGQVCPLTLQGIGSGSAKAYQYSASDTSQIAQLADIDITNGVASVELAPMSITLIEIPASARASTLNRGALFGGAASPYITPPNPLAPTSGGII